jgi:hypothetical protein
MSERCESHRLTDDVSNSLIHTCPCFGCVCVCLINIQMTSPVSMPVWCQSRCQSCTCALHTFSAAIMFFRLPIIHPAPRPCWLVAQGARRKVSRDQGILLPPHLMACDLRCIHTQIICGIHSSGKKNHDKKG